MRAREQPRGRRRNPSCFAAWIDQIKSVAGATLVLVGSSRGWVSGIPDVVKQAVPWPWSRRDSQSLELAPNAVLMFHVDPAKSGEEDPPHRLPSLQALQDAVLMQPVKRRQYGL
jgi:hypothetical protein